MSDRKKPQHGRQETLGQMNMGVILTGYLGKMKKHHTGTFQRRFVVLTYKALHWFEREDGYDLFGKEANHLEVSDIIRCEIVAGRSTQFEVEAKDKFLRRFEAEDTETADRWVRAIKGVIDAVAHGVVHRLSVGSIDNTSILSDPDLFDKAQVLLLTAQATGGDGAPAGPEIVLAKDIEYEEAVEVPHLGPGQVLHVLMSDGSCASLPFDVLEESAMKGGSLARGLSGSGPPGELDLEVTNEAPASCCFGLHEACQRITQRLCGGTSAMPAYSAKGDRIGGLAADQPYGPMVAAVYLFLTLLALVRGHVGLVLGALGILVALHCLLGGHCGGTEVRRPWTLTFQCHRLLAEGDRSKHEIPTQFLDGCPPLAEATRRWDLTRRWREAENIDDLLMEPQPNFQNIKRFYPHFCCGRTRDGDIVYYEQVGSIDLAALKNMGLTIDQLIRHYLFTTEFTWRMTHPRTGGRTLTVFDVAGVALSDLAGDAKQFLVKSMALVQNHYPERSKKILIINAPGWFSIIWKAIRGWINEETRKKVAILTSSETSAGLEELVDRKQIPSCYGGELVIGDGSKDATRFYSPQEVDLRLYVEKLNARYGADNTIVDMPPPGLLKGESAAGERAANGNEIVLAGDLPAAHVKGAYDIPGESWTMDGPEGMDLLEVLEPAPRGRSRSDTSGLDMNRSKVHRSTGSLATIFNLDTNQKRARNELARSENNSPVPSAQRKLSAADWQIDGEEHLGLVEGSMEHPVYRRPQARR